MIGQYASFDRSNCACFGFGLTAGCNHQENRRQAHEISPPIKRALLASVFWRGCAFRSSRVRSGCLRWLQRVLLALTLSSAVHADVFLSEDSVDVTLKKLDRLVSQIHGSGNQPMQLSATFALGEEARVFADFLNKEVAAHGEQERRLLETAIERAAKLGVNIIWSGEHRRFYYDGAAFRRYLEMAPQGPYAADCRFIIIEQQFYFSNMLERESLAIAVTRKQDFLQDFPRYVETAKIGIFLSIDYRDLWRHCRELGDHQCASHYLDLTRQELHRIASDYESTSSGNVAARMLIRIEKENSHDF